MTSLESRREVRVEYVEVARAVTSRGEVVLRERRDPDAPAGTPTVVELRVNGVYVMDTLETGSERALASIALDLVPEPRAVVVGGLGFGFTLHQVLADHRVERVAVVEVEEPLVQWMRDGTVPHGRAFLADERVHVVTADIVVAMAEATAAAYDLVLLDVDNGPDQLVHASNHAVYEEGFLEHTREALRPGGIVAIWSAHRSEPLEENLDRIFGNVDVDAHEVVLQGRDEHYWLYRAQRER